ncbi:MAG: hypothetical protein IJP64_04660 [Oscillospiraceae bacterium]|nr:hypothetical protein [Oscillospiraceae bacterium]
MKNDKSITAFYIEVLMLTVGLILIVLVLTHIFALGRSQSAAAQEMTDAVCLAQNAAEAVAASSSPEELLEKLDEGGNCGFAEGTAVPTVRAVYDRQMRPDTEGELIVFVTWEQENAPEGELAYSKITVTNADGTRQIYSLRTAVFIKGAGT